MAMIEYEGTLNGSLVLLDYCEAPFVQNMYQ